MDLRIKSFFAAAFALPFLFSCTTLQQDVNIEQVSYDDEVVSFERRFSEIDAESLVPDADVNGKLLREQRVDIALRRGDGEIILQHASGREMKISVSIK